MSAGIAGLMLATPLAADEIDDLRAQTEALQRQMEQQQEIIEALQRRLEEVQRASEAARETADEARQAVVDKPVITSGNERIRLEISGQVNRMVNVADDGDSTKLYNVDNDNSSSRIRFVGTGEINDELTVGATLEAQLESNSSADVNQRDEDTGSASFTDRIVEVHASHERLGRLALGQGPTASDSTAEVDLSGSTVLAYSSVTDTAGGLLFFDDDTDELSNVKIGAAFSNLDGLGRLDRIRYDTPKFHGFSLAGSIASDERYDAALRWSGQTDAFQAAAAAAWWNNNDSNSDYGLDGSVSVLHKATGLNLTLSGAREMMDEGDDPWNLYVKGGWLAEFFAFGKTALVADYTYSEDVGQDGDEATSFGLAAVQHVDDYGIELFLGFRNYSLDRNNTDFDDISVVSAGSRVKF